MTEKPTTSAENRERIIGDELDPASQSLSEALNVSFRVLGALMVILIIGYLFSGVFMVKSDEVAVKLRFGTLVADPTTGEGIVYGSGTHFSWPYPIEKVIRLQTSQKSLDVTSFWFFMRPGDKNKDVGNMSASGEGLRPGFDGALMTSDRGLMHVIWTCRYQIDPDNPQAVRDFVTNIGNDVADAEDVLARSLENASIQVAANYSVEAIRQADSSFKAKVQQQAQTILGELKTGIVIRQLQLHSKTPPLQTLSAFKMMQSAQVARASMISEANKAANNVRIEAAGANWKRLALAMADYDLALMAGDATRSQGKFTIVDDLLVHPQTTGLVSEIINDARGEASAIVSRAKESANLFTSLLPDYKNHPKLTISRLWLDTAAAALSNPKAIKNMYPPGMPIVLQPEQDPARLRKLERLRAEEIRAKTQALPPGRNY